MDSYLVCEAMARKDIGLATAVFATFLGSDPIVVGATEEQKQEWLGAIAEQGVVFAYGATEPEAGSDLGAMTTTATPVTNDDGEITAYVLNGRKQWISNGSIADFSTILAATPEGPTWFVVPKDTPGFTAGPPEDKHGLRLSNTAALFLDEVAVFRQALLDAGLPADELLHLITTDAVKGGQMANTEAAVAAGAFGSPSFLVGTELFFGKDRLRDVEEEVVRQAGGAATTA